MKKKPLIAAVSAIVLIAVIAIIFALRGRMTASTMVIGIRGTSGYVLASKDGPEAVTITSGTVPVPMVVVEGDLLSGMDPEKINAGDEFTLKEQVRLRMDTMTDPEGKLWMPLFLNMDELEKGETANVRMEVRIMDILKAGLNRNDVEGVVVNPFDKPFVFRKNMLGHFIGNMEFISKREIV